MWPGDTLPYRDEAGQTTVEWTALLAVVALALLAVLAAAGAQVPGAALARTIAAKIVCAVELSETCAEAPDLVAAYGVETAELVRAHAPWVFYEQGMTALPVDYRECRESGCSTGDRDGEVYETASGQPLAAFVHLADCRQPDVVPGLDCSGTRAGKLYIQYWFYYVDSATLEGEGLQKRLMRQVGRPGFHEDDWESYQVRIGAHGAQSRAGSHHGYNYEGGPRNWFSDAGWGPNEAIEDLGLRENKGWGPETKTTWVSGGSHAGHVKDDLGSRLAQGDYRRWTPPDGFTLIPLEPIASGEDEGSDAEFAITAPWSKEVWANPEFDSG